MYIYVYIYIYIYLYMHHSCVYKKSSSLERKEISLLVKLCLDKLTTL